MALVDTFVLGVDTVLVGTPSHPVFVNDQWQELEQLANSPSDDQKMVTLSAQYVAAFYNL